MGITSRNRQDRAEQFEGVVSGLLGSLGGEHFKGQHGDGFGGGVGFPDALDFISVSDDELNRKGEAMGWDTRFGLRHGEGAAAQPSHQ